MRWIEARGRPDGGQGNNPPTHLLGIVADVTERKLAEDFLGEFRMGEEVPLGNDIKDIYSEAKSAGFDVKVLRQIIRIRKQEPAEVEEQESLLDVYRRALGM